jgi:hypothetical protein
MPTMGRYCKAFPLASLRRFSEWNENASNARTEVQEQDGRQLLAPRPLADSSILYLHENLVVTDGIFVDEHVIFDAGTPEWEEFCRTQLEFSPPPAANTGGNADERQVAS